MGQSPALAHYGGGGGCHGYNCNKPKNYAANNGPYHSYTVRPAIYGGHGLYTYKGYARHGPAYNGRRGQNGGAHYRAVRSSRYGHQSACQGYNCHRRARQSGHYGGGNGNRHYGAAKGNNHYMVNNNNNHYGGNRNHYGASGNHYGSSNYHQAMRPTNSYGHHQQGRPSYHQGGYEGSHGQANGQRYGHARQGQRASYAGSGDEQQQHYGHHQQSYGHGGAYRAGQGAYRGAANGGGY